MTNRSNGSRGNERSVLVAEHNLTLGNRIAGALRRDGFAVTAVANGAEAIEQTDRIEPDVLVLDSALPDINGYEVLQQLRSRGHWARALILTTGKTRDERLRGLSLPADDYLEKPFSLTEVVVRIHAAIHRSARDGRAARLALGDLQIDQETLEVQRAGSPVHLTVTEFNLLRYLLLNAGRVRSKQQILDDVWEYDFNGNDNVVETYISYLRKKLDRIDPPLIRTVRGYGYVLKAPSEP